MYKDKELRQLCVQLKPLIGHKADALWAAYVTSETMQSKLEAETFIQLVAMKHLGRDVSQSHILLAPPSRQQAHGEFELGNIQYGTKPMYPIFLSRSDLNKHTLISGITGSGKTNVAYHLLLQLLAKDIPWLVVDWKRSYRHLQSVPQRNTDKIKVFTIGRNSAHNLNWNPLRAPPGIDVQTWIAVVAESLERSHVSGQGVADVFMNLVDEAFSRKGFYDGEQNEYPNFFDAQNLLLTKSYKGRRQLWSDSCQRILRSFTFGTALHSFNARNPVKLEKLLHQHVIIELDQELPKPLRVFFSDMLLRWLHLYRLGMGEKPWLKHVLLLEEVHNLLPRSSYEKQTTNSLENVFREVRSFGQGIVGVTQHPSLLPIYLLGNCNTLVFLGLQHQEDISVARRSLYLESSEEKYLDWLQVGEGVVKVKGRIRPCHVKFPLSPVQRILEERK